MLSTGFLASLRSTDIFIKAIITFKRSDFFAGPAAGGQRREIRKVLVVLTGM